MSFGLFRGLHVGMRRAVVSASTRQNLAFRGFFSYGRPAAALFPRVVVANPAEALPRQAVLGRGLCTSSRSGAWQVHRAHRTPSSRLLGRAVVRSSIGRGNLVLVRSLHIPPDVQRYMWYGAGGAFILVFGVYILKAMFYTAISIAAIGGAAFLYFKLRGRGFPGGFPGAGSGGAAGGPAANPLSRFASPSASGGHPFAQRRDVGMSVTDRLFMNVMGEALQSMLGSLAKEAESAADVQFEAGEILEEDAQVRRALGKDLMIHPANDVSVETVNGNAIIRMNFDVTGPRGRGTAIVKAARGEDGVTMFESIQVDTPHGLLDVKKNSFSTKGTIEAEFEDVTGKR